MKRILLAATLAALPSVSNAGPIERACIQADRPAASRSLCGCIQRAADVSLTNREQRKSARFFRDPHKAQETRQSDRTDNERFWKRYKNFASKAARMCG